MTDTAVDRDGTTPVLDDDLRARLGELLTRLRRPVELRVAAAPADAPGPVVAAARRLTDLVGEVARLSPLVRVVDEDDPQVRRPSVGVAEPGRPARIRFAGAPLGHELSSFVLAVLHTGGHPPVADERLVAAARDLPAARIVTWVSLACAICPETVQSFNLVAAVNPQVTHEVVDGAVFDDDARAAGVLAVPTVVTDGSVLATGRVDLTGAVDLLGGAVGDGSPAPTGPVDVAVIGAGPAGCTAAVYAARKGLRTVVVAERIGGQVLDTASIENLTGTPRTDGPAYARDLATHLRGHPVDIVERRRARRLEPGPAGGPHVVVLDDGTRLQARAVILATGASWRRLGVPGEEEHLRRGVTFCPHCDGPLFAGRPVAVVGGGNSGVEAAIDLAGVASHVTLLELAAELRADAVLLERLASLPNVTVHTCARTLEVLGDGERVRGLRWERTTDGTIHDLAVDGVFVQIGLVPATGWLAGTVELAPTGEIVVDDRGRTSVPGVFAAGDCATTPFKQITVALGSGSTAALAAFEHLIRQPVAA